MIRDDITRFIFTHNRQAHNAAVEAQVNTEISKRISSLESDVSRHREESGKAQAEVDRLLDILRQMENEKNDKDRKISELERSADFTLSGWRGRSFITVRIRSVSVQTCSCSL